MLPLFKAATLPPFIASRRAKFSLVAFLFTTNSPGVRIAGTVSLFPVPGTTFPPLLNPFLLVPLVPLLPAAPIAAAPTPNTIACASAASSICALNTE